MKLLNIAHHLADGVVAVLAVTGNSLVIASVCKFDNLKTSANFFVGALAVSDMVMACSLPAIQGA